MNILGKSAILAGVCAFSAALLCGAPAGTGPAAAAPSTAAPPPPAERGPESTLEIVGTVRSVDAPAKVMGLLTGVGHALRLVQVSMDEGTRIQRAGAAASLRDLKAGDVVQARIRRVAGRAVAESIEIRTAGGGQ